MAYLSKFAIKEKLGEIIHPRPLWCSGYKIPKGEDLVTKAPEIGIQYDPVTKLPITNLCRHRLVNGTIECQEWVDDLYMLIVMYGMSKMSPDKWIALFPQRSESGQKPGWPVFSDYSAAFPKCPGYHFIQVNDNTFYKMSSNIVKKEIKYNVILI